MEIDIKTKLTDDLKQAMRDGDTVKRSVIRMVMAGIKNAEIARRSILNDGEVLALIAKEVKRHHESIEAFKKGNREDLIVKEEAELAVLSEYLPRQLTKEEIIDEAREVILEVGAQNIRDKGKVMPKLINKLSGQAEGGEINAIVTELLQNLPE
jgi:uncharacterized protein YqeY